MNASQLINQKLTKIAKEMPDFHRLTPSELEHLTNIPHDTWYEFMNNNEEIRQFINRRTNEDIEFAHRKSLHALALQAGNGNVQAIKELNQLSGILNQNKNRQIVTHFIPRPSPEQKAEEKQEGKGGKPHDMPQL